MKTTTQDGVTGRRGDGGTRRQEDVSSRPPVLPSPRRRWSGGQGTTEIALMLPLFVILLGGVLFVGYMCWQGLKVQQAANLAARIQGQERVAGGYAPPNNPNVGVQFIRQDNGIDGGGDKIPDNLDALDGNPDAFAQYKVKPTGGVYGK